MAGFLVGAGTSALLIFIVVSITGGFVLDAGPLHFSAQDWRRPLAFAAVAFSASALTRHASWRALSGVLAFVERHGSAAAVVLAASAAGIGVGLGTHAASSADAAGYLLQARRLTEGRMVVPEPLATEVGWPEAEWSVSPLGYRPGLHEGEVVPTYPPGLPMVMAVARAMAGEVGPYLVVPLFGALAVACTYLLGARLHGRLAGVVAAAFMTTSPVFLFQIVQPMSDVPAVALWAAALVLATAGDAVGAGLLSGLGVLTRPSLAPLSAAVALALLFPCPASREPRSRATIRRGLLFGLSLAVGLIALAIVQWQLYGSPLASGHGAFNDLFALGNVVPNVWDYSVRLVRGEPGVLALALVALLAGVWSRRTAPGHISPRASARLLLPCGALLLLAYLPYGVFPDWSYLRFLLPAFPLLFVAVAAGAINAAMRLPSAVRGVALLAVVTVVCATNVVAARREQAFNLRRYESRYRTAGRYLEASLPERAVIVTSQHSASARYYTGRTIVRWDLLNGDFEAALRRLDALGRHPVLLVEDWEAQPLRARFPTSELARVDWPPRADVGTTTRVRVFDPADKGRAPRVAPDRLP